MTESDICAVCYEMFNSIPFVYYVNKCGHVICEPCLERDIMSGRYRTRWFCPICRGIRRNVYLSPIYVSPNNDRDRKLHLRWIKFIFNDRFQISTRENWIRDSRGRSRNCPDSFLRRIRWRADFLLTRIVWFGLIFLRPCVYLGRQLTSYPRRLNFSYLRCLAFSNFRRLTFSNPLLHSVENSNLLFFGAKLFQEGGFVQISFRGTEGNSFPVLRRNFSCRSIYGCIVFHAQQWRNQLAHLHPSMDSTERFYYLLSFGAQTLTDIELLPLLNSYLEANVSKFSRLGLCWIDFSGGRIQRDSFEFVITARILVPEIKLRTNPEHRQNDYTRFYHLVPRRWQARRFEKSARLITYRISFSLPIHNNFLPAL